jgi:hypothetical protein
MDFTEVSTAQLFARIVSDFYFILTWIHSITDADFMILKP